MNLIAPKDDATKVLADLLALADVELDGNAAWDIRLSHPWAARRILAQGSMGLGESYMDGWWECDGIDAFLCRILRARLNKKVRNPALMLHGLKARLLNLQSQRRAWQVAQLHYDLDADFFVAMLDPSMAYSCGYWDRAETLAQAQQAKLDLVCRKLGLRPGMRLLDIGCGWGSLMKFAARNYGVSCVGLTVSKTQAEWGRRSCEGLPVEFILADYRQFNADGGLRFDRVASIGMFEHVGKKNYPAYFAMARRSVTQSGLLLLHTIGSNQRGVGVDPWIERYIFPNGELPSMGEIADAAEPFFVIEDWHGFGADYDRTLMAWHQRFEASWPVFAERYGERFRRMWRYYLLACAGSFRARDNQLWQVVLSPDGVAGGYRRVG